MTKRIGTIDCETDPFKYGRVPEPFVWGLWLDDTFTYFWGDNCTEQLVEYLQDENDLILYAHNGGKFDFFFMLDHFDANLSIVNGRIARASLFDGSVEVRDSWLILPLPLSAMEKDDFDYTLLERPVRRKNKDAIVKYLKGDVYYLHKWVMDFIDQFGLNLTLASTAFKQLRKTDYEIMRTFKEYDETFRPYYFGGRVQCFDVGSFYSLASRGGGFKYIDINSAYPYAMTQPHWYGSQYFEHVRFPDGENGSWFAHVRAKSKGALPWRCPDSQKLLFPDDMIARDYWCTGWEILAGLKTNTIEVEKIHKTYRPLFKKDFTEYVDRFFAMKKEADEAGDKSKRLFAKLMLNSCYGKFGQDGEKFEEFCLTEQGDWPERAEFELPWTIYSDHINGHCIFSRPKPEHKYYNVATAASVTGFVRAYLWGAIQDSRGALYCDTDSIICREFNGKLGKALGEWDVEAELTEIHIAQKKMYAGKTKEGEYKIASKGVRFSDSDEEKFKIIKESIAKKEEKVVYRDAPAFSLKYGPRFFERTIDFKNIEKNTCNNPQ